MPDIGVVRQALEGAFETIVQAAPTMASAVERPFWRRAVPVATAGIVGGLLVATAAWMLAPTSSPPVIRLTHNLPEGRRLSNAPRRIVAISPDGRNVAYLGAEGVYLRPLDSLDERTILRDVIGVVNPVFSPGGESLAYQQGGQLRRVEITGGTSTLLTAANPDGVSWEADGTLLYALGDTSQGEAGGICRSPKTAARRLCSPRRRFRLALGRAAASGGRLDSLLAPRGWCTSGAV